VAGNYPSTETANTPFRIGAAGEEVDVTTDGVYSIAVNYRSVQQQDYDGKNLYYVFTADKISWMYGLDRTFSLNNFWFTLTGLPAAQKPGAIAPWADN
jgi:hypothetical protein